MKDYLCVIDMQNDFVDGSLGTKEAEAIVPYVAEFVRSFEGEVIFTRDTHDENYMETQEGKVLPVPHCVKGTKGWDLIPELDLFARENGCRIFDKPSFGTVALADFLFDRVEKGELGSVTLIGVCTDICVISNALIIKARMPEVPMICMEAGCAGVTPEKHRAAMEVMRSCQVQVR